MDINKNIPRILTIAYIIFISIFALDANSFVGWIIHMLPSFVLVGALVFSWKKPKLGSVVFLFLGIIFTIYFSTYRSIVSLSLISLPLFILSALFLWGKK